MPPPLAAVVRVARLSDDALPKFELYELLREEQRLATSPQPERREIDRILDLAQSAYGRIVALVIGRDDAALESARDGEWSLRDLLRHLIAVELRYAAQVQWAATRSESDPLAIPAERLPCDRLAPTEPEYASSRTDGIVAILELLGRARRATDERLEAIGDEVLERPSLWGQRAMSIRMRLHQTAAHLVEGHVQADKMLGVRLDGEARRILGHACAVRGAHERWTDPQVRADLDARYAALKR